MGYSSEVCIAFRESPEDRHEALPRDTIQDLRASVSGKEAKQLMYSPHTMFEGICAGTYVAYRIAITVLYWMS